MAKITNSNVHIQTPQLKRAIHFNEGDVLIHVNNGHIGLRTEAHIVRQSSICGSSLYVNGLEDSTELFTLAPAGTSFTVTAE